MRDKLTYEDQRKDFFKNDRAMVGLLITVSVSLLVVTALGIIGLASFWCSSSKQIGIRRALVPTAGRSCATSRPRTSCWPRWASCWACWHSRDQSGTDEPVRAPRMPLYYLPLRAAAAGPGRGVRRPGAAAVPPAACHAGREMRACRMLLMALLPLPALAGGGSSQTLEWRQDDARLALRSTEGQVRVKPRVRKPARAQRRPHPAPGRYGCAAHRASCRCAAAFQCPDCVPAAAPRQTRAHRPGGRHLVAAGAGRRHRRHRRHQRGAETSPPSSPRLWLCLMGGAGSPAYGYEHGPSAPPIPFCRTA